MLSKIKNFSKTRLAWFLLLLTSVVFLACGFYFQYHEGLQPCHLCIVQRIAFLAIGIGSLIALIKPQNNIFKFIGTFLWAAGGSLGLYAAIELVYVQAVPSNDMFGSCALSAEELMNSYPILEWFPMMFKATGDCGSSSWNFYGIATMEQLTLVIFSVHIIALLAVVSSYFKKD